MSSWMTMEEVTEELGVARSTMDEWRATGRAPKFKKMPNGRLRCLRADLATWLESLENA